MRLQVNTGCVRNQVFNDDEYEVVTRNTPREIYERPYAGPALNHRGPAVCNSINYDDIASFGLIVRRTERRDAP